MEILFVLLILLLVTKAGAELAVRVGQPALVGELVGGVLLGFVVTLLPNSAEPLAEINSDRSFAAILDLAVFFLMLVAGLEMRPKDLVGVSGKAAPVAIAGMLVPLVLGLGLGWWWLPESDWKFAQSLFLGVALAITAVPVAVKVLMDLDSLQTETGQLIIAAAVIDDILSLVLLAILTALLSTTQELTLASVALIGGKVVLFFGVALLIGRYGLQLLGKAARAISVEYAEFTVILVFGIVLAVFAEWLHMHFLIGAFTAGLIFTRNVIGGDTYSKVQSQFEAVTLGFLAPIFFASIGIHLSLSAAVEIPAFVGMLLLFAFAGKLLGAGGAALAAGMRPRQALAIGSAMNARGAVEIIIADIALRAGLFDHPDPRPAVIEYMFSAVVIMAIVTTLFSPIMLRYLIPRGR
ncbi:MAG: cation:proton antiporter [Woeseiaceae bacterium]|nr:cation:proton antiporter [Woeseiaceae bacterium]